MIDAYPVETVTVPPSTIRGAQISVGVDWLEFTVWGLEVVALQARLGSFVGGDWSEMDRGAYGYSDALRSSTGARILHGGREDGDMHVILPGSCVGAMDEASIRGLMAWVRTASKYKVSRLDLRGDDYLRVVSPGGVYRAWMRGEHVTHAHSAGVQRRIAHDGTSTGEMFTVGSRGSRQYLRVYDKALETKGETDSIRWELEFRDEAAGSALDALILGRWGEVWASRLVQFADFRDPESNTNVSRRARVAWFRALVDAAVKAAVYFPSPMRTVAEVREWFRRQVAPTLALLVTADAGDLSVVYDALDEGRRRMGAKHRAILAASAA